MQSTAAPAVWRAWSQRRLDVEAEMRTVHEGLATRVPFEMTMEILWRRLDDLVLVTDEEIEEAIRWYARDARLLAEGAAAAPLAAAARLGPRLAGRRVVGVLSGGNLSLDHYARVLGAG